MSLINRTVTRFSPRFNPTLLRRRYGGHGTEEELERTSNMFRTISHVSFYAFWVILGYCLAEEHAFEHQMEDTVRPAFPFRHIRNKPFPWGTGDKGFMEELTGHDARAKHDETHH